MIRKQFIRALVLVAASFAVACGGRGADEYVRVEGYGIGTTYRIVARASKDRIPDITAAADSVFAEMTASMSIFDSTSLLSRLNRGLTDSVDCHIERMIELSTRIGNLSGGLYDVTVAPLTQAYGFAGGEAQAKPNIDSILEFVGYRKIAVENGRLVKQDARTQLDFNSIAKGYTVDCIARTIERMGIGDYMVEVGGEIVCRGINPRGSGWRVAVDSPFDGNMSPGENCQVVLEITGRALATSGNYRRFYVDADGRKIAHTINPQTGESAVSNLLSATVIAPTCAEADALGTTCMAVGLERARELISSLPDVDAYLVYAADGHDAAGDYMVWCTPAVEQMIVR